MGDLLAAAVIVAVIVAVRAIVRLWHGRVRAHGLGVLAWRWLSGNTWHGDPVTDAGWLRPGRRALTRTGFATRWHHLPRWKRAAWRTGITLVVAVDLASWLASRRLALAWTAAALTGAAAGASWRAWRWAAGRRHRSNWLYPLHITLGPVLSVPLTARPESWLEVAPDRSRAVIALPSNFDFDAKVQQRVLAIASAKLGMEAPEAEWRKAGPTPLLTLTASAPPPARVALADIREALEQAGDDELVWGLGKQGRVVRVSLSGDSPHIGLSMGSGAGKSVTARMLAAAMLNRGCIVLIIDYKMISHQWAQGLPNVVIARRPAEMHEAFLWLGREIERRSEVALAGADIDGNVRATVGPRLIVICEELNAAMNRLRAFWTSVRENSDPKKSPAIDAFEEASFMGRQVLVNLVYIGQRLSVKAAGSGDARENIGIIGFARYTASNWKMLASEHAMPPSSRHPGRLQVVTDKVTECQVAYLSAREARHLAVSGTVSALPAGMPGARAVTGLREIENAGPDQGTVTISAPPPVTPGPVRVTLREAVAAGIVSCTLDALQMARHRDPDFPPKIRARGLAYEYDAARLAAWDEARST